MTPPIDTPVRVEPARDSLAGIGETNLFQRILLVSDGTVTRLLEAYAGEPIRAVTLGQTVERSSGRLPELELDGNDEVMRREVLLQGARTGTTLLHAVSWIVPDRLPPSMLQGLREGTKPIGLLLVESRMETFREILGSLRMPAGLHGGHLGIDAAADVMARTYRILSGGRPILLITERFPAESFSPG